jgi:hypothetical protein
MAYAPVSRFLYSFLFIFLFLMAMVAPGMACEPCAQMLDLKGTIAQAQLVIVGQRVDFNSSEKGRWAKQQGPETVQIKVLQTWKGSPSGTIIRARSWYGMCPYGVVMDDQSYVLFLVKEEGDYTSVNSGCSIKSLPFAKDAVTIDGDPIPLAEFKKSYGF